MPDSGDPLLGEATLMEISEEMRRRYPIYFMLAYRDNGVGSAGYEVPIHMNGPFSAIIGMLVKSIDRLEQLE